MRTVFATLLTISVISVTAAADPALPTIDDVFPPSVRIETAEYGTRVTRIAVEVQRGVVWISFDTASRSSSRTRVSVDLPAGTQVVGMAVTSHDTRGWSELLARPAAAERARDDRTTALLEWDGTSAGEDHVHLDVDANARAELAVLLPPGRVLAIAPNAPLIETPAGQVHNPTAPIVLDVSDLPPPGPAPVPHASKNVSLLIQPADTTEQQLDTLASSRFSAAPSSANGKRGIRGGFKLNQERFTHCYERTTQFGGPRIEGTVALQFVLEQDGSVSHVASASDLPPDITGCVEDVVAAWTFPRQDSTTIVNYPLTFKLAD